MRGLKARRAFNPDTPLDYLTMVDQVTGDVVVATVESGAWTFSSIEPLVTESGDRIATEDGDVLILE